MASEPPAPLEGQVPPAAHTDAPEGAQKPPVKRSWRYERAWSHRRRSANTIRRRKYRKMRAKFEETMNTSNQLIKDEFRAMGVARRLQGQNECVSRPAHEER